MKPDKSEKSKANIFIIWDTKKYPEWLLGKAQGKVHDKDSFEKSNFGKYNIIYVLAELKWKDHIRTDFYGFKLAKELREKLNVLCPIVICSFLSRDHLIKLKIENSDILNYPGHYLLQLPDKPITADYKPIDDDTLEDIRLALFNPDQVIHELMHNTEDALPGLISQEHDKKVMKDKINELIEEQFIKFKTNVDPENHIKFGKLLNELKEEINKTIEYIDLSKSILHDNNTQRLRGIFSLFKPLFYNVLPVKSQACLAEVVSNKRWHTLYIDDIQENCTLVRDYFKQNKITCQTALNAEDAFKIIQNDENQSKRISLIIADYRLYEKGDSKKGIWQELQGYRILNEIHSDPKFKSSYVYAILTSKTGTIQKHIRKQSRFPILWFSKSDVLGGGIHSFNLFCRDIEKAVDAAFLRKRSVPNTAIWRDGYKNRVIPGYFFYYKLHFESDDYRKAEIYINTKADQNIEHALKHKYVKDSFDIQMSLIYNSTSLNNNFDNSYLNSLIQKFRNNILIPRRIYWILRLIEGKSDDKIIKYFNKNNKTVFSSYLGIPLKKIDHYTGSMELLKPSLTDEEFEFFESYKEKAPRVVSTITELSHDYRTISEIFEDLSSIGEIDSVQEIYYKTLSQKDISLIEIKNSLQEISKFIKKDKSGKESFMSNYEYLFDQQVSKLTNNIQEIFEILK